jgi:hypothetical protein
MLELQLPLRARLVLHAHVDTAGLEFGHHLVDPLASRRIALRLVDPADIIVALIVRPGIVVAANLSVAQRLGDIVRHVMKRSFGHDQLSVLGRAGRDRMQRRAAKR